MKATLKIGRATSNRQWHANGKPDMWMRDETTARWVDDVSGRTDNDHEYEIEIEPGHIYKLGGGPNGRYASRVKIAVSDQGVVDIDGYWMGDFPTLEMAPEPEVESEPEPKHEPEPEVEERDEETMAHVIVTLAAAALRRAVRRL